MDIETDLIHDQVHTYQKQHFLLYVRVFDTSGFCSRFGFLPEKFHKINIVNNKIGSNIHDTSKEIAHTRAISEVRP